MKHCRLLLTFAVVVACATTALSAPVAGVYTSADLGGSMLQGRTSQSWATAQNTSQGLDDVFNSQSWNGSALGTQWGFSCGNQPNQQTEVDDRVSGTGVVAVTNTFEGGAFYLNPGPWGSGTGTLGPVAMTSVVSWFYIDFQIVSARQDIDLSGAFDNSNCRLTLTSQSGDVLGDTDSASFPVNFPGLLDPTCNPTRLHGSWAQMPRITMSINCPISTELELWGRVKAIYR